jgi:hypothetical protein
MKIRLRPITAPFARFLVQAKGVLGLWLRVVGGIAVLSLIFGPYAPLGFLAIVFTLALPILLLALWGKSLDQELGWIDIDEGPW